MKSFIIKFILLTIGTLLMTFVLEKDYKVNGLKRVVTNSKYSKIAYYLGLANIVLMLGLLETVYDKYIFILDSYPVVVRICICCGIFFRLYSGID